MKEASVHFAQHPVAEYDMVIVIMRAGPTIETPADPHTLVVYCESSPAVAPQLASWAWSPGVA